MIAWLAAHMDQIFVGAICYLIGIWRGGQIAIRAIENYGKNNPRQS